MPLLRIDIVKGRSEDEKSTLLQAIHDAVVTSFSVPDRDRYQVLMEHDIDHLILEDTGLGFMRSRNRVLIQIFTRKRSVDEKQHFYRQAVRLLEERCGISPLEVVISCTENGDADWSFGFGRAQFLSGELPRKAGDMSDGLLAGNEKAHSN
jgi:phenylpyruvate tautomerase PptA (4-oxalocrotonate tautomerase family)